MERKEEGREINEKKKKGRDGRLVNIQTHICSS